MRWPVDGAAIGAHNTCPVLSAGIGPVVQRLERTAHNGVVGGSNPSGPTTFTVSMKRRRKCAACYVPAWRFLSSLLING